MKGRFGVLQLVATTAIATFTPTLKTLENVITEGISIVIDSKDFVCTNVNGDVVEPMIYNGTTYIPVRAVSYAFGKAVSWDGNSYTVYLGDMDGALVTESTLKHLSRIVQGKEKEPAICEFYNTHSLRHTFASRLRASGTEEHIVQALLGHKSTKETKTYLHITENEYLSVSLHMNNGTSKVDAVLSFIASQNLSEYQKNTLIDRLKNTV